MLPSLQFQTGLFLTRGAERVKPSGPHASRLRMLWRPFLLVTSSPHKQLTRILIQVSVEGRFRITTDQLRDFYFQSFLQKPINEKREAEAKSKRKRGGPACSRWPPCRSPVWSNKTKWRRSRALAGRRTWRGIAAPAPPPRDDDPRLTSLSRDKVTPITKGVAS